MYLHIVVTLNTLYYVPTKEQGEHHVFEIQKEQQFREKGRRRRKKTPGSFCGSFV